MLGTDAVEWFFFFLFFFWKIGRYVRSLSFSMMYMSGLGVEGLSFTNFLLNIFYTFIFFEKKK